MRAAALAAALGSALALPAGAAPEPVSGACHVVEAYTTSPLPTVVLAAEATATAPMLEIGVACWIAEGGEGYANASNPGVAVASAGTGTAFRLDYVLCEQHWGQALDGTWYFSPIACW